MNLPNQLTLARLGLTGVMVMIVAIGPAWAWSAALVAFVLGSLTDWFDGWYARKYNLITAFGALMDPLADKVLTGSAFILLTAEGKIAAWAVTLIMAREFLVTGLRLVAASQGAVLSADKGGKWKTGAQIALIIYWMLWLAAKEEGMAWVAPLFALPLMDGSGLGAAFLWLTVVATVGTGIRYLLANRHIIQHGAQ